MSLLAELKDLLPTPVARWSALLTSTLLLPAFLAPRFLQPLLAPKATEAEIVLAQILMPALIILFGSLFTLLSVIRAYNTQKIQHAIELQKQREHYESLAEAERAKRFAKPLNISNKHIV
jgi:hypothetical protein